MIIIITPIFYLFGIYGVVKKEILNNRKVLVINGEDGDKNENYKRIKKEGVKKVY